MTTQPFYILSEQAMRVLRLIETYTHLSSKQVAIFTGQGRSACAEMLLRLERQKLLGFFGNKRLPGGCGSMAKHYFLTKRGHEVVAEDCSEKGLNTRPYSRRINHARRWTPLMAHRDTTIEIMMALERDVAQLTSYESKTFVEYRKRRVGKRMVAETEDYVAEPKISENKIISDAAFVLRNVTTGKRALFFIECDMGTTTIEGAVSHHHRQDICYKFTKYDRYLMGRMFRERYRDYGDFQNFVCLFITTSETRQENIRRALSTHSDKLHDFYRFSTMDRVMANFFHDEWRNRSIGDNEGRRLIKG